MDGKTLLPRKVSISSEIGVTPRFPDSGVNFREAEVKKDVFRLVKISSVFISFRISALKASARCQRTGRITKILHKGSTLTPLVTTKVRNKSELRCLYR